MSEPIRVLHITGAMYPGGYENFIMNLYENMDRSKIQFDMVVHARKENDYVPRIEAMGGRVYELPRLTKHPVASLLQLYKLVKRNQYAAVIRHTPNALVTPQLLVSRMAGAFTICHSHSETDGQKLAHRLGCLLMPMAAKGRFSCSEKAASWMYGKNDYTLIHNAIDLDKFAYDSCKVELVKEEFPIDGKHVFGYIANLIPSKNHVFLMDIFSEITRQDPDAVLFCLGEGVARPDIEAAIRKHHLKDKVFLTGIRYDPQNFLSAFDVLIFPSIYEGLPLSLIEAQASGVQILMSDTITDDVIVTNGLVHKKSLDDSAADWATDALRLLEHPDADRSCQKEAITAAGYNIKELVSWFTNYIESIAPKKK